MAILKVWDDTRGGGRCRSCEAPITWFQLTSGKRMPFNGEPTYVKTETDPATRRLIGHIDSSVDTSHFASCPESAQWRREA